MSDDEQKIRVDVNRIEHDTPDEAAIGFILDAARNNGIPLMLTPSDDHRPPPPPEFYFDFMRDMLMTTGSTTGAITFATVDMHNGMMPLMHLDAVDAVEVLTVLIQSGEIAQLEWVSLAAETIREIGVPEENGEVTEGFGKNHVERWKSGDPSLGEAIMVICAARDKTKSFNSSVGFTRRKDGSFSFEEPMTFQPDDSSGDMHDALQALVS